MADGDQPVIKLRIDGTSVDEWPSTILREREVRFFYEAGIYGPISGTVHVGIETIGTFTNQQPDSELEIEWIDSPYTLESKPYRVRMPKDQNLPVSISVYTPDVYEYEWDFNRYVPPAYTGNVEAFFKNLYRDELDGDLGLADLIKRTSELVVDPGPDISLSYPETIQSISDEFHESNLPDPKKFVIVKDISDVGNLYTNPTAQDILDTYDHYISHHTPELPADTLFTVTPDGIASTANVLAYNALISPTSSDIIYQGMHLSSSDADDDHLGCVIGYKEDSEYKHFLVVTIYLSLASPVCRIHRYRLPIDAQPNTGDVIQSVGLANIFYTTTFTEELFRASFDIHGLNGWQQAPWNDGIYLSTLFDGERLIAKIGIPGGSDTSVYQRWDLTSANIPNMVGFKPHSGVFNFSQGGGLWKDYTVIDIGNEVANLSTGTLWRLDDHIPPNFVDTGISLGGLLDKNRYGYSERSGIWMYKEPTSGLVREAIGREIP